MAPKLKRKAEPLRPGTADSAWADDLVQFSRLLIAIQSMGVCGYGFLVGAEMSREMQLTRGEISSLFTRAEHRLKEHLKHRLPVTPVCKEELRRDLGCIRCLIYLGSKKIDEFEAVESFVKKGHEISGRFGRYKGTFRVLRVTDSRASKREADTNPSYVRRAQVEKLPKRRPPW